MLPFILFLLLSTAFAQFDEDPFYLPPAGFASTAPGTVLRSRPIIAAVSDLIPIPVEAHQLLYRTRSINGSAIATVTTILKPGNANGKLISYQTAEDSSWIKCSPSLNLQLGKVPTDPGVIYESLYMEAYLTLGYTVSTPDYEGPDAAFAAGRLEGYGVLDSMRAASTFLGGHPPIVGAGYSGGAIATGWAASLQAQYAPELPIKGWTIGGTPANLTGVLEFIDGTIFAGLLPTAIDGLNKPSSYGAALGPIIRKIATPYGQTILDIDNVNCQLVDVADFVGGRVLSYQFQSLGPYLPYQPTVASVLTANIMGLVASETPIAPVLLYHASQDEIIPYANATTLFHSWCDYEAKVQFTTYESGGHATTEIIGFVEAVQYTAQLFSQAPSQSSCSANAVLNPALDPLALGLDLEPILSKLLNTLVQNGPDDGKLYNSQAAGRIA